MSKPPEGRREDNTLAPGLYVVATPIGHAQDITLRALSVLRAADVVACEDTRVTSRLMAIHGIKSRLTPYHDHNAPAAGPALIERIEKGGAVALVSDAGTPLLSDPGYRLVRSCIDLGIAVIPVPGASAILTALCVAGLPTDRFLFAGFPPPRKTARRRFLTDIATVPATLVLMESPRRLAATLCDMADIFGARDGVVARELTKVFEELRRGTLVELASHYSAADPPRGEVTLVTAPPPAVAEDESALDGPLFEAMAEMSPRSAAERIAAETGMPFRRVYSRAIRLTRERQVE